MVVCANRFVKLIEALKIEVEKDEAWQRVVARIWLRWQAFSSIWQTSWEGETVVVVDLRIIRYATVKSTWNELVRPLEIALWNSGVGVRQLQETKTPLSRQSWPILTAAAVPETKPRSSRLTFGAALCMLGKLKLAPFAWDFGLHNFSKWSCQSPLLTM